MENLPSVEVSLQEQSTISVGEDNICGLVVSGVAVAGQFALGDVLGPFYSVADAEAKGINAAYDTTNTTVAHKHIKDFYDEAGEGTKLYVMVVAKTVTLAQILDKDLLFAAKLMDNTAGEVSCIAVGRTPAAGYVATYENQFDADLWAAVTKAKAFRADQFAKGRTLATILIEGRDFQGTASSAKDFSLAATGDAEFVSIVIGNDNAYATANAHAAKYAAVGLALGTVASVQVQRNIGRVLNGPRLTVVRAGLSNGAAISTFSAAALNTLNGFRYLFLWQQPRKSGWYWNGDHCLCPVERLYNAISRCRPIMKAIRIVNATYVEQLLDDPELDPETGRLDAAAIKDFQSSVQVEITERMITQGGPKEISGITCICDPTQNVQATGRVKTKINIVPKGMTKGFDVEIGYVTSLNQ
jgi:hypothetical protein